MNHYQTVATASNNGVLKRYLLAVLVGVLLGGAYVVTGQSAEGGARILSSTQPLASPLRAAKALSAGADGATSIVNRGMAVEPAPTWTI